MDINTAVVVVTVVFLGYAIALSIGVKVLKGTFAERVQRQVKCRPEHDHEHADDAEDDGSHPSRDGSS